MIMRFPLNTNSYFFLNFKVTPMKYLSITPTRVRKSFYIFGPLVVALYFCSFGNSNITISKKITSFFAPDTIPPVSDLIADTINVTAIYQVTDTLEIFADGLDSIIILQEDTTVYYIQNDTTVTYYIGEVAELVSFEKPNDTIAYYFATDTAAYYIPKDDTIAYQLINAEATGALRVGDTTLNSEILRLEITSKLNTIQIAPSTITQVIPPNLYGTNIADMFGQKQEPEGFYGEDQWQILSDLAPNVIRIASGGSSMLMHLLHDPNTGLNSQGYGYVLDEIVHYYDNTDGSPGEIDIIHPDWTNPTGTILGWTENQKNDAIIQLLADGWITDSKIAGNCFDYVQKYKNQLLLPPGARYLDSFVRLIQQIENDASNGNLARGLRVNVIVCLNIISETAEENKEIIRYLRDNDIYDVEVYGVEMRNECYDKFYQSCMGFNGFETYFEFLTGEDSPAFSSILRPEMIGTGHAHLQAFKTDPEFAFSLKVGVVGYDRPDPIDNTYQLRKVEPDDEVTLSSWNADMALNYFDDGFTVSGSPISVPAFDAVIIHPYYGTSNFQTEILSGDYIQQIYSCATPIGGLWDFTNYDVRLKPSFDLMTNKFLTLFKTGYEESLYRWGQDLGFAADGDYGDKEIWMTEWNYKDAGNYSDSNEYRMTAFENTFLQGLFTFDFNLKNIKINFDGDFWSPFMPIATFHSFGGGGNTELVNFCQDEELVYYYNNPEDWMTASKLCDDALFDAGAIPESLTESDGLIRHYYVKHTPYFATELIGVIYKNNLQLLKSTFKMPKPSPGIQNNLQPTVFIDPAKENLYIFYSNAWGTDLNFKLEPAVLLGFYIDALGVEFGTPYIEGIDAEFPYSTAGRCPLYDYRFNTCYSNPGIPNSCDWTAPLSFVSYPIDLTDINVIDARPDRCGPAVLSTNCITVPGYSFGYIKLPILPFYERLSELIKDDHILIYPNPTTDYFTINSNNLLELNQEVNVSIYALDSTLCGFQIVQDLQRVDISNLAKGCYAVNFRTSAGFNKTEMLIKN